MLRRRTIRRRADVLAAGQGLNCIVPDERNEKAVRLQYVRPPEPRFFDQSTAAAYLGISERTFEHQWRSYKIPYPHRIGRRLVWDRKLLDGWADIKSGIL